MTSLRSRSVLALPFIGLACLGLSLNGLADSHQQSELKQLKRNISALEQKLATQRQQKGQLQTQIEIIEIDSSLLSQNIRNLKTKITSANKKLNQLNTEKNILEQRINNQRNAIAQQIRSMHKTGHEESLKLLLNQQDPQKFARNLKYYDYLIQARGQKIKQFTANINQLEITVADIKTTKITLAQSKKSLEQDRKKLAAKAKKRQKTLVALNKSLLTDNEKLTGYQKQRKQLEDLIKSVKQAAKQIAPAQDYPPFVLSKGKLSWPVKGKLKNTFGTSRDGDLRWEGWLINTSSGAEVKAIYYGRVVFSNYLRGFGLLVIVDHGDGYMSLYAHNQELLRETGDWIQSGDIISRAGNTGGLTNHALYFEIRQQGIPVNPKLWLGNR